MKETTAEICQRLAQIRQQHYGPRGRLRFATDLGLTASTYAHYERDRLPPVDVLLRAARLTQTRLEWLIEGAGPIRQASPGSTNAYLQELLHSVQAAVQLQPELLGRVEEFAAQLSGGDVPQPHPNESPRTAGRRSTHGLIPVVGSTSAGPARFWSEIPGAGDGRLADSRLEELLADCSDPDITAPGRFQSGGMQGPVSLVQCSQPDDRGVLEFLDAPQFQSRRPRCVAWRIDGVSMAPRYLDGDLVIAGCDAPAVSGQPCIARQRGQLGVNCKIYREEESRIALIPINDAYPIQFLPREELVWAWRVLASVRL